MKLAEWRAETGQTLDDVAAALGVDRATVHRWETGQRDPSRAMKQAIFTLSAGKVEPNDFYDLALWRTLVSAALAKLRGVAA